jgi:hypothetical protein
MKAMDGREDGMNARGNGRLAMIAIALTARKQAAPPALCDRVIDLKKIERLCRHDPCHRIMTARRSGDADVAHTTRLLPFPQRRELRVRVDQIVHLHQID